MWDRLTSFVKFLQNIVGFLVLGVIFFLIAAYYYDLTWRPYDDLHTHATNITWQNDSVWVQFDSNVSYEGRVAPTGSMLPIIGGNDKFICIDAEPQLGDIVVANNVMHMVYRIEDEWVLLRGYNNQISDPFKFPRSEVDCVVAMILR